MIEPRALARAAAVLVAVAVLVPATAAYASLPSDVNSGSRQSVHPSDDEGATDGDDDWYEDLGEAADDGGDEDGAADDEDAGADDATGAPQQAAPTWSVPRTRPGRPRAVSTGAVSSSRASVRWTAGRGAKASRFMVSLVSAHGGRMRFVQGSSRTVTFTALKPRTRYTATVTAVGAYGTASASTRFRTPAAPKRAAAGARTSTATRSARDLRVAKAIRFG